MEYPCVFSEPKSTVLISSNIARLHRHVATDCSTLLRSARPLQMPAATLQHGNTCSSGALLSNQIDDDIGRAPGHLNMEFQTFPAWCRHRGGVGLLHGRGGAHPAGGPPQPPHPARQLSGAMPRGAWTPDLRTHGVCVQLLSGRGRRDTPACRMLPAKIIRLLLAHCVLIRESF